MIKYADENVTRVSMRSKNTNVSEIAQSIGGGGHIRAAGATVYKNLDEAREIVLNAIVEGMKKQNA